MVEKEATPWKVEQVCRTVLECGCRSLSFLDATSRAGQFKEERLRMNGKGREGGGDEKKEGKKTEEG